MADKTTFNALPDESVGGGSRLMDISLQFRQCSVARNDYGNNSAYVAGHPDALSTGDEDGKGEVNGQVGGTTDIRTRECSIAKNKFQKGGKEYNAGTV